MPSIEFSQPLPRPDHGAGEIYGYERETPASPHRVRNASAHPLGAALDNVPTGDKACFSTAAAAATTDPSPAKDTGKLLAMIADAKTPQDLRVKTAHELASACQFSDRLSALLAQKNSYLDTVMNWEPGSDVTLLRLAYAHPHWPQLDAAQLLHAILELSAESREPDPELWRKANGLLDHVLSDDPEIKLQLAEAASSGVKAADARALAASGFERMSLSGSIPRLESHHEAPKRFRSVHQDDPVFTLHTGEVIASNRAVRMTRVSPVSLQLIQACVTDGRCAMLGESPAGGQRRLTGIYSYPQVIVYDDSGAAPATGMSIRDRHEGVEILPDPNDPGRCAVFASGRKKEAFLFDDEGFISERSRPVAYIDRQTGQVTVLDQRAGPYLRVLLMLDSVAGQLLPPSAPPRPGFAGAVANFFSRVGQPR